MIRQRWLTVGLVVVGAAVAFVVWGPWAASQPPTAPAPPPSPPIMDPADVIKAGKNIDSGKAVTNVVVKSAGGPCKVTVTGGHDNSSNNLTANLQDGEG